MAMETNPKYRADAGTGTAFSVRMVRAAVAFHEVMTAGFEATTGSAWLGEARAAEVATQTVATTVAVMGLTDFSMANLQPDHFGSKRS